MALITDGIGALYNEVPSLQKMFEEKRDVYRGILGDPEEQRNAAQSLALFTIADFGLRFAGATGGRVGASFGEKLAQAAEGSKLFPTISAISQQQREAQQKFDLAALTSAEKDLTAAKEAAATLAAAKAKRAFDVQKLRAELGTKGSIFDAKIPEGDTIKMERAFNVDEDLNVSTVVRPLMQNGQPVIVGTPENIYQEFKDKKTGVTKLYSKKKNAPDSQWTLVEIPGMAKDVAKIETIETPVVRNGVRGKLIQRVNSVTGEEVPGSTSSFVPDAPPGVMASAPYIGEDEFGKIKVYNLAQQGTDLIDVDTGEVLKRGTLELLKIRPVGEGDLSDMLSRRKTAEAARRELDFTKQVGAFEDPKDGDKVNATLGKMDEAFDDYVKLMEDAGLNVNELKAVMSGQTGMSPQQATQYLDVKDRIERNIGTGLSFLFGGEFETGKNQSLAKAALSGLQVDTLAGLANSPRFAMGEMQLNLKRLVDPSTFVSEQTAKSALQALKADLIRLRQHNVEILSKVDAGSQLTQTDMARAELGKKYAENVLRRLRDVPLLSNRAMDSLNPEQEAERRRRLEKFKPTE